MTKKKVSIPVLVVLIAALAATNGCRKAPEPRAEVIVSSIADRLDLNRAQRATLNAMKEQFQAKAPGMKETREETFDAMIATLRSPAVDQARLNSLMQRNKAQADELITFIFSSFTEFHDMLTPGQREKAAAEMERWREKYRMHGERR